MIERRDPAGSSADRQARRRSRLPLRFAAWLGLRMIVSYVAVAALISSIYLVQQFVPLLENAARYAIGGWVLGKLLALTLPRLIEFALPLAALTTAYFVLLEARERREFLILSAGGASSGYLACAVLMAGFVAAGLSIAISGFVKPAATFAYRSTETQSRNAVLSKEIPTGAFYAQQGRVLYSGSSGQGPLRLLRMFEFDGERLRQVVMSDCSRMKVAGSAVIADTCDLYGYRFGAGAGGSRQAQGAPSGPADCEICLDAAGRLRTSVFTAGPSSFSVVMERVFREPVRDRSGEMYLPELLRTDGEAFASRQNAVAGAIKLVSALSSIVGILLAVIAVAFSNARMRVAALPLACVAMMGVMVLVYSQTWLLDIAAGRAMLLTRLGGLALVLVPVAALVCRLAYDRLVAPAMAKA